jgi:hypothetical protein
MIRRSTPVLGRSKRCIFGTDYPQEIRDTAGVAKFVSEIRALGADGKAILEGNTGLLLKS